MIDLHTHSTFSDGSFTPEQLVLKAERIGLSAIALTDHDSIDGIERFLAACEKSKVRGVAGIEISVEYESGTMHMLGYFVDHHCAPFLEHLAKIRAGRISRNEIILKKLNQLGFPLTIADVSSFAGETNVGRLHFAQALISFGFVKTRQEAFDRFLAKGKSAYAERFRLSPVEGIAIIQKAGGLAVLAHPSSLNVDKQALNIVVSKLAKAGLQGLEVYSPKLTQAQVKQYQAITKKFDLVATGGSDFHGDAMPGVQLGTGFGSLNVPDSVLVELDERRRK